MRILSLIQLKDRIKKLNIYIYTKGHERVWVVALLGGED